MMDVKQYGWFVWLETKFNEFNMMTKSVILLLAVGLFFQLLFITLILYSGLYVTNTESMIKVVEVALKNFPQSLFSSDYAQYRHVGGLVADSFLSDIFLLFLVTSPISAAIIAFGWKIAKEKTRNLSKRQYVRGAKLIDIEEAKKQMKNMQTVFELGEVPLPHKGETDHILVVGSSGSGKTQLLKKPIKKAKELNTHGIIHDIKGDWISEFYIPSKDIILNPMDKRSVKWTIWNDIDNVMDLKNFAQWLIPDIPNAKDPFWQNSARMILESILLYLYDKDLTTNQELKTILYMKGEDVAELIRGYGRGADLAAKKDSYNTLQSQMGFIDFLQDGDFSIKKWVKEQNTGYMFLSNTEQTQAIMKPVLSLATNIVASALLNMLDDMNRRFYIFLDEFTSLTKLEKIIDLLKLGRSKGASVWIAFQDFQQTEKIYSREDMRTIINNTATLAVLRLKEPDAALYFSKRFAKMEFIEKNKTTSMGVAANRDGLSFTEQQKDDFIVKDSEILTMPTLTAFVSINHIDGVVKTKIGVTETNIVNQPLEIIEMTKKEQIRMMTMMSMMQEQKDKQYVNDNSIEETKDNRVGFFIDEIENMAI